MSQQRVQLALNVANIDEAVEYYGKLFGVQPAKRKPGYANFAITTPPLKLVLFESAGSSERINHLGVEVFDSADVAEAAERFKAAGIAGPEEQGVCCYAEQDKIWSEDPQGLRWEWYRVIEDSETFFAEVAPADVAETKGNACACC